MPGLREAAADHDVWVHAVRPADNSSVAISTSPDVSAANNARVSVVVDGTLFDADALAERLSLPASPLPAAALVLEAYERLGDNWLSELSGHFAIVVHDRQRERFLAARDRMGQRPLFHTSTGGTELFSSSIDALLTQPGISQDLNRVALAEHLAQRWPDLTETYYERIFRIPPGHVLELDGPRRRLRRYWDLAAQPPLDFTPEEAHARFDAALERAVERAAAQGRTAIFLSGGLDSISIAAVAADHARRNGGTVPHALSLGFPDPACDEEFVQRGAAETLGCGQDFLPFSRAIGTRGLLVSSTELSATLPAPLLNVWQPAFAALGRMARDRGRSVILTGTGGDEWLSVTPYLSADLMKHGRIAELMRFTGVVQRSYRMSRVEATYGAWWRFGARPLAAMLAARLAPRAFQERRRRKLLAGTPSWIAPDPRLRKQIDERADRVLAPSQPAHGSFYEQEMRTALDHALISLEHEESFEFGRRLGVTFMHPYCDADLVELLYRTPPSLLYRGGRSKGLVRGTIARRFPALGLDRQRKVNATGFYLDILQREGAQAWACVEQGEALAALGVVDGSRLTDTMHRLFVGGDSSARYKIWSVLNLAAWAGGRDRRSTTGRIEP